MMFAWRDDDKRIILEEVPSSVFFAQRWRRREVPRPSAIIFCKSTPPRKIADEDAYGPRVRVLGMAGVFEVAESHSSELVSIFDFH